MGKSLPSTVDLKPVLRVRQEPPSQRLPQTSVLQSRPGASVWPLVPLDASPPRRQAVRARQDKILAALHFLVHHNELYRQVRINYPLTDDWGNDFIPSEISDNITYITNTDHHEREGYTASLRTLPSISPPAPVTSPFNGLVG